MNIELIVTNIVYTVSFVITVAFGLVVYLKGSRKITHIMFLMMSLAIAFFQIGHVFGINAIDPYDSLNMFLFSISFIFIGSFNLHWILSVLGKDVEKVKTLTFVYFIAIGLSVFYALNPNYFLEPSVAKLYLPNYYVPGDYFYLALIFFGYTMLHSTFSLFRAYKIADSGTRNKLLYFIIAIIIGFPLGASSFFLAFNISFDPIFSALFSLYIIPLAYGILKYDLMDVKFVAKKAFTYALLIVVIGFGLGALNILNNQVLMENPDFPQWVIPLISAVLGVFLGGYVWEKFRDLDVLKYEFITVVTHRFRTPLTRIKWATEMLRHNEEATNRSEVLQEIDHADELLVELTDMLVGLGRVDDAQYFYTFEKFDICEKIKKIASAMEKRIHEKNLRLNINCEDSLPMINADIRRLQFAIQIVIENAFSYTPKDGKIDINTIRKDSHIIMTVKDSGIGISSEDINKIFTKFFRSHDAKSTDTEGMGIGLFMAKQIIERHGGSISVDSKGRGLGSTFTINLPFVK